VVLAACSGGSDASDGKSDGGGDGDLDRSATLRWGATAPPTTLDPQLESNSGKRIWLWEIYDRLFLLDKDGNLQPGIAESGDISSDGLTITLKLRDDAKFHDGSPVNAAAVKYSLERGQKLSGSIVAPDLELISAINVVDDSTVALTLTSPAPYLLKVLATSPGVVINPASEGKDLANGDEGLAGSGPYEVGSFEPNANLTLKRVEGDYWDSKAANFATIEVKGYPDPNAAMNALQTGEIDATLGRGEPAQLKQIASTGNLNLYSFPVSGTLSLFLRNTIKPLEDLRVREAIARGIDRKSLSENLFKDVCEYNPQAFIKGSQSRVEGQDPFPYDPKAAKALLAEAGYPNGFELPVMVVGGYAPAENGVLVVQEDLAKIGIKVKVNQILETDQIDLWRSGSKPAMFTAASSQPDDVPYVQRLWFSVYGLAEKKGGKEIQAAIDAAVKPGLDEASAKKAYENMGTVALKQGTLIPVCNLIASTMGAKDVVGLDSMPLNFLADAAGDPRYLGKRSE